MTDYNYNQYGQQTGQLAATVSSVMKRVYLKMTLGLIATAVTALAAATSAGYMSFLIGHGWFMWVLIIAWFGVGIGLQGAITKISSGVATLMFYAFAVLNGLMLCTLFYAYSPEAIVKTFFITAATFGAMTIYGYCTSSDLTRFGNFLFYALIGVIIASVVNIFMRSSGLDWIISIVGVLVFIGLTAWDTQQIKRIVAVTPAGMLSRMATLGALNLYLDFVNLFLFLLRIFGGNRN